MKVEPTPSSLSAKSSPPIPRARSRLMGNPSPVPSVGLLSARPTCFVLGSGTASIGLRMFVGCRVGGIGRHRVRSSVGGMHR